MVGGLLVGGLPVGGLLSVGGLLAGRLLGGRRVLSRLLVRVCLLCLLRHCSLRFLLPLALCPEGPGSCGGCAVHCGKPRAGVMGHAVAHSAQQRTAWLELRRARVDGLRVDQPPRSLTDRSFDEIHFDRTHRHNSTHAVEG